MQGGFGAVCARVRCAAQAVGGCDGAVGSAVAVVRGACSCNAPTYAWAAFAVARPPSRTEGECRVVLGQSARMRAAPRRR